MIKWKEYYTNIGLISENLIDLPIIYDELPDTIEDFEQIKKIIVMDQYPQKVRKACIDTIKESIEMMEVDWEFRWEKNGTGIPSFYPKQKSDFKSILLNISPITFGNHLQNYYKTPASVRGLLEHIQKIDRYSEDEKKWFVNYMVEWYGDHWTKAFIQEHLEDFLKNYYDFELTTEAREAYMTYLKKLEKE